MPDGHLTVLPVLFMSAIFGLSFSETCVLLLEKNQWKYLLGSKSGVLLRELGSTNMAQLWFGLVFRYEFLSVSFFATGFSPGRTTYFFLETNLKRMNMHASNDFH